VTDRLTSRREGLSESRRALLERWVRGQVKGAGGDAGIPRRPAAEPPVLSFAQERLWFLDQLEPGTPAYDMFFPMRLRGRLAVPALAAAFGEVLRRHEVLRSTFHTVDGRPALAIAPFVPRPLPLADLAGLPPAAREREADRQVGAESYRPFDLARGPLARCTLLRLGEKDHLLLFNAHHIVFDGWSVGVLLRELGEAYRAFAAGRPSPLPALPIGYLDFARWQRQWLAGEVLARQLDFWRARLAGAPGALDLPADRPRPPLQTFRGGRVSALLPRAAADRLAALARGEEATLFMALLAGFKALLQRLTGASDLVVGTPIAGRNRAETEGLIGFFINTLVLRTDLSGEPAFRALLRRVRDGALAAYAHQDLPFEKLVEELAPRRDLARTPLFQVFFNLVNLAGQRVEVSELALAAIDDVPQYLSKFDLTVYASELPEGVAFDLLYNADLFDRQRIVALGEAYVELLEQLAAAPDRPVGEPSLRAGAAAAALPDPRRPLPRGAEVSLPALLRRAAERHADRPALAAAGVSWSHGELAARAGRLARALRRRRIGRGDVVAVHGERGAALVVAVLGALAAGAAFLLLDPAHPAARRADCARQAAPRGWIEIGEEGATPPELAAVIGELEPVLLHLSPAGEAEALTEEPAAPLAIEVGADDLAYVAFTSGSTGQPKGILGTHRPVAAFLDGYRGRFALSAGDRFALLSGLAHDPLLRDLLTPLALGGHLSVPPPELLREPAALRRWLARERVSVTHLTPSFADFLLQGAQGAELPDLRLVLLGGEPATFRQVARLAAHAPRVVAAVVYGATETPQAVSCFVVEGDAARRRDEGRVPVGRGRDGVDLLVVNARGGLCGVGELGEIQVRSRYLAAGYLGDEALTRERFVANPWCRDAAHDGEDRLYRTGDLGRYRPDGAVEVAGRLDRQLKVRGYRVEPAEVEAALAAHPGVREAAAVGFAGPGGEAGLAAFAVAAEAEPPAPGELRDWLRRALPEPLVPSHLEVLAALPLTANGKLDRDALARRAAAAESGDDPAAGYVAPRDGLELALAALWQEVLGRGPVGVRTGFFDLGGHSLLAVRLLAAVRARFGRELPLSSLFQAGTVERLAVLLRQEGVAAAGGPLVEIQRGGDRLPLFCVHPAGGNVTCFAPLARALGPEQPVYGLESQGLCGGEVGARSIEEMATAYLSAVRAVRPAGPYALLGWSLGGLVAFEMARRLAAEGERVALLALLDTRGRGRGEGDRFPTNDEILLSLAGDLALSREVLAALPPAERVEAIVRAAKAAGALSPDVALADVRRLLAVYRANVEAGLAYVPPAYPGSALLFRAAADEPRPDIDLDLGWRERIGGGLEVCRVPGSHRLMVAAPQVEVVAERLRERLAAATAEARDVLPPRPAA
jgi:amino acid adenylation domain-containing protein